MTYKSFICLIMTLALTACGKGDITVSGQLGEEVTITPDYKDVTIPPNIAPLNFQTEIKEATCLIIEDEQGNSFQVHAKEGLFIIPVGPWKALLQENKGKSLTLTVCKEEGDKWKAYNPFNMHVAEEEADPYIAYRLLVSCYGQWNQMGIYQRNISNYDQTPIYENNLTDYNCINCHSFPNQDPTKLFFHMRAKNAGTVLIQDGNVQKLNTATPETMSALVYPYWHPSGHFITTSVNKTFQSFFYHHENTLEVYDTDSDVVIYDVERQEIFSSPALKADSVFESFPTFSPDGHSLYFLTARAKQMPVEYKDLRYSLCRIDFDPETRTLGQQVDTIFNAEKEKMSVSFPRISPDGRFLVFGMQEFGNFSAWHKDCDLYCLRLNDGEIYPLTATNSDESESYHSWSSNSRWMVFSSRRMDGLFTRTYFTYIDKDGVAHKPFLLPQKNPVEYYDDLLLAYNLPEFIKDKVVINPHKIATVMRNTEGVNVTYRKD